MNWFAIPRNEQSRREINADELMSSLFLSVDSLIINAGERYDFVLSADQEIGNYWIRYRGFGECAFGRGTVSGEAILRYSGADDADPSGDIRFEKSQRFGVVSDNQNIV